MDGLNSRKELIFWWTGFEPYERVTLEEVESTFKTTPQEEKIIQEKFKEYYDKNKHFFDGTLWRYENIYIDSRGIVIGVSPITYMPHNVLRHEKRQLNNYPNPISINAVQVTTDGYIPVALRREYSDQKGLAALGSGFIRRKADKDGNNFPPETIFHENVRKKHHTNILIHLI